jgi:intron-binding protein aquarius
MSVICVFLMLADFLLYAERFIELLIDLQSQLPTRKYTNALILDLNVSVAIHLSPLYKDERNRLFRDLVERLDHYLHFAVNSYTSAPISDIEAQALHRRNLTNLQKVAMSHFKEKLTVLALSNHAAIDKRGELIEALTDLTDDEVVKLCDLLYLRTLYPNANIPVDRNFLLEVLVATFQRRENFVEQARKLNIYPNEVTCHQ